MLLIEGEKASPIISGREQREKRNGKVIVRLDGERDHVEKIGADSNFDKWQPTALPPVLLVLQIDGPAFYRVFIMVSATPIAINNGNRNTDRFQCLGYSSR